MIHPTAMIHPDAKVNQSVKVGPYCVIGKDVKINYVPSDDNRSYHVSSQKIFTELGFKAKFTIEDAVLDLKNAFDNKLLHNCLKNIDYFNIKKMQNLKLT